MAASTLDTSDDSRMPALDGLRGVATLAVVLYHFALVTGLQSLPGPARMLGRALSSGWLGVDVFFVLSGYLITSTLLHKTRAPHYYRAFFARRLLRVVPLYLAFLIVYLWLLPPLLVALGFAELVPADLARAQSTWPWLFTYTANMWMALTGKLLGAALEPIWSLCVEIHYYLLWPLLVRSLAPRGLVRFATLGLVAAAVLRVGLHVVGTRAEAIYMATPTRLDAVLVGTLLAAAAHDAELTRVLQPWVKRIGAVGVALLGAVLVLQHGTVDPHATTTIVLGYSAAALSSGMLLSHCLGAGAGASIATRLLTLPPLRMLGRYSYSVYLFNLPVITVLDNIFARSSAPSLGACLMRLGVAVPILAGLSALSWYALERKCLELKHAFPWGPRNTEQP